MFCGDGWLQYLKPDQEDPGRPGHLVRDRKIFPTPSFPMRIPPPLGLSYAKGGWYAGAVGPPPHFMASAGRKQQIRRTSGSPICKGESNPFARTTIGATTIPAKATTFCSEWLNLPVYSVAAIKPTIQRGASLDDLDGGSQVMLHEFLHLFVKSKLPPP